MNEHRTSGGGATWAAAAFAVLSLSPAMLGVTANAEHFVLLPVLAGFLALAGHPTPLRTFLVGVCFGLALCAKQQAVFFAGAGLVECFLAAKEGRFRRNATPHPGLPPQGGKEINSSPVKGVGNKGAGAQGRLGGVLLPVLKMSWMPPVLCAAGMLFPLLLLLGWLWSLGALREFVFWTWSYSRHYGGMWTLSDGWQHFVRGIGPVMREEWPLFLAAAAGLVLAGRQRSRDFRMAVLLLAAGFLATCPGLIFRPHYFLFLVPGLALAAAGGLARLGRWGTVGIVALLLPLLMQRDILFRESPVAVSRLLYPHNAFPEARLIGEWLKERVGENDRIGILGSEPQIAFYAQRRLATPHVYLYPLLEPQPHAAALQRDFMERMEKDPPPWLVHVRVPTSWLAYPDSPPDLLNWTPDYLRRHYEKEFSLEAPASAGSRREMIVYRRVR